MPHHSILIQLPISTHVDAVTLTLDNLKRKLRHMNEVGDMVNVADMNLLQKALLYVSDSQAKLNSANQQISRLSSTNMLNPGDMLSLQVKINAADQDVQFCTASVGKMVDAVKTLMNIQV